MPRSQSIEVRESPLTESPILYIPWHVSLTTNVDQRCHWYITSLVVSTKMVIFVNIQNDQVDIMFVEKCARVQRVLGGKWTTVT